MKAVIFTILLILLSTTAIATTTTAGEEIYVLDYYSDNLILAAGNVLIDSEGVGDVIIASGQTKVNGKVGGDLTIVGGEITVSNVIEGDLRVICGSITINSLVKGDLVVAGGEIRLTDASVIEGDVIVAGGEVEILGNVNEDVQVYAGEMTLGGNVGGNAEIETGDIRIQGTPTVAGDLTITSPSQIQTGQVGVGGIFVQQSPVVHEDKSIDWGWIIAFLMMLFTGIGFIALFTRFSKRTTFIVSNEFLKSMLIGLLSMFILPMVVFLLLISIVGIPLGVLFLLAFIAIILLSKIFLSAVIGRWFIGFLGGGKNIMLNFFIGLIIVTLLVKIPYVGPLFNLIVYLSGTGAFLLALKNPRKGIKKRPKRPVKLKPYTDDVPAYPAKAPTPPKQVKKRKVAKKVKKAKRTKKAKKS